MPVLINKNVNESCKSRSRELQKNYNIRTSISPFYHHTFLLSFDLSPSCKLQLIDLITVSAICLAGRQTILVRVFLPRTVKWVRRKTKETNGWKIKNVTGRFLVQIHPSRFVSRYATFSILVL